MKKQALRIPVRVRCIAWRTEGQWVAATLEFGLGAQGASFAEVKRKIEEQMVGFLKVALSEDSDFARRLLSRRAPSKVYAMWYAAGLRRRLGSPGRLFKGYKKFIEPMPTLAPA